MSQPMWRIVPHTLLGKWSVGLMVVMPVLFFVGSLLANSLYKSVPAGETVLKDVASRPALTITMLAGMVAGILALITGLLAIIRQKENALLSYLSTAMGALLLVFLAGEALFPH